MLGFCTSHDSPLLILVIVIVTGLCIYWMYKERRYAKELMKLKTCRKCDFTAGSALSERIKLMKHKGRWAVYCKGCGHGEYGHTKEEAIEIWNIRQSITPRNR